MGDIAVGWEGAGAEVGGLATGLRAAQPLKTMQIQRLAKTALTLLSSLRCGIELLIAPDPCAFASHRAIRWIFGIIGTRESHRKETIAASPSLALEN